MYAPHFIKKLLALTIGYSIVIFGIFILQFRTGATFQERCGALRISLTAETAADGTSVLQNMFTASFRGISFFAREQSPLTAVPCASTQPEPLVLESWERHSPFSIQLSFSENVSLIFTVSDDTDSAYLTINAFFPEELAVVTVPYIIASGFSADRKNDSLLEISNNSKNWIFAAAAIDADSISFTAQQSVASYRFTNRDKLFAFADTPEIESASNSAYRQTVTAVRSALISAAGAAFRSGEAPTSEQEAVSFVAAMAETGRYTEAVNSVPQSFRRSTNRTYLSAPYFNSLAASNATLSTELSAQDTRVRNSTPETAVEILAAPNIENYLIINQNSAAAVQLLTWAAEAAAGTLSVSEAVTVVRTYNALSRAAVPLAERLAPAARAACSTIETYCVLDNNTLFISENGSLLPALETARAADALVHYGLLTEQPDIARAGYLMLTTALTNSASFDRETLAVLYPIITHNNTFYPHVAVLHASTGGTIWAWTVARSIRLDRTANSIQLMIDFPYTHHVIFRGVPSFAAIYIYDTAYRTDPRFETYNSSGYIYQSGTESLLLKSRHRDQVETIVLEYRPQETTTPALPEQEQEPEDTADSATREPTDEIAAEP